jgi:hypothetical protein
VLEAVLRVGNTSTRQLLATEAAALSFAEDHQLAAPRLLAVDLDGAAAGRPALLMTVLADTSTIPTLAPRPVSKSGWLLSWGDCPVRVMIADDQGCDLRSER